MSDVVEQLRNSADDCEHMDRWAVPELAPELREAAAENERLRADNADMVRMLRHIMGDDEYLRIYAIEEALHHPSLNGTRTEHPKSSGNRR